MNVSNKYPGVAQLVAHLTGGQGVVSSSLATRTSKSPETAMVSGLSVFAQKNTVAKCSESVRNQQNICIQMTFIYSGY